MNVALLIGRGGSQGLPGKNLQQLLGRPLMNYPILAARSAGIERIYLSTDDEGIRDNGAALGCELIERPPELATSAALPEDAFKHGYEALREDLGREPDLVVLLFCNGVTITPGILQRGFEVLGERPDLDSAITVSRYTMWSPTRAKRLEGDLVQPYLSEEQLARFTCDRNTQGEVWYADCSAFVVRPYCFDYDTHGQQPFRWYGKRAYALQQWGGLDVDEHWQMALAEYWLRQHGFSEESTPYDA